MGRALSVIFVLAGLVLGSTVASTQGSLLVPRRMVAIGDSFLLATHARLPFRNLPESFAVGYQPGGFRRIGYETVDSHMQRIGGAFGAVGLRNAFIAAPGLSMVHDFPQATAEAVADSPTYVAVMLGANDVCGLDFAAIPTDSQFENSFRAGLTVLQDGLAEGATVYVMAIPDLRGIVDMNRPRVRCRSVWRHLTRFAERQGVGGTLVCPTLLGNHTEAELAFVASRLAAFNAIMDQVVAEFEAGDPFRLFRFGRAVNDTELSPEHISNIDCFHPSAEGQAHLATVSWADGPFGLFTAPPLAEVPRAEPLGSPALRNRIWVGQ